MEYVVRFFKMPRRGETFLAGSGNTTGSDFVRFGDWRGRLSTGVVTFVEEATPVRLFLILVGPCGRGLLVGLSERGRNVFVGLLARLRLVGLFERRRDKNRSRMSNRSLCTRTLSLPLELFVDIGDSLRTSYTEIR